MKTMLLFATIFVPIALVVVFVGGVSYYNGYKDGANYTMDRIYEILNKQVEEIKLRLSMDIETEENEKDYVQR